MLEIRYHVRQLRHNPGYTAVAILTLALGIGANTAIFSIVEGIRVGAFWPYAQPDRLVTVRQSSLTLKREMSASYPDLLDWQRSAGSFERMAAFRTRGFDLTSPGTAEHFDGKEISAGFLDVLGVKPSLGREFVPEEDRQHGATAAIISERLWRNRFGGGTDVIGKTITLDGLGYTIVGVTAPVFQDGTSPDVYTPLGQGDPLFVNDRSFHPGIGCIARLRPGVSVAAGFQETRRATEPPSIAGSTPTPIEAWARMLCR